ncbi:MAG TPA: T9SS type A sorting domain-containing protein, partial [Chitinophagaceae bacterium]|nr:T9SS type A sorting domain-containing protein [Chitinophagaceae bacterium]
YWGFVADSRTAFVAPIAFAPSNGTIVYQASDNLHKSTNSGASFTNDSYSTATNYIEAIHKTGIALAVSPTNANKVYVSTSPFAQYDNDDSRIYVTGQPNILKTTTGNTPFSSIKGSLPDRFVTDIAISKTNDDSVFITLGGFGTSHIYVTGNGGTTWTSRGAGLPDVPFNAIVFDPVNANIIYAGCDFGVYVSADRGATWIDYNDGFWDATLVMDLQISSDNKLIAATHGKGAFRANLFDASTLPVRLLDFSGFNRSNFNELKWVVSQEHDLRNYELERSIDGIHYSRIATKTPNGSNNEITYSYNDPVLTGYSEFYYRLKMVDNDGRETYSSVIFIRTTSKTKISVTNNPFKDMIALQYNISKDELLSISLFNVSGALLKKVQYKATAGSGAYTLYGVGNNATGIYFLRVEAGEYRQSFKLFKN